MAKNGENHIKQLKWSKYVRINSDKLMPCRFLILFCVAHKNQSGSNPFSLVTRNTHIFFFSSYFAVMHLLLFLCKFWYLFFLPNDTRTDQTANSQSYQPYLHHHMFCLFGSITIRNGKTIQTNYMTNFNCKHFLFFLSFFSLTCATGSSN